jgi:hypothetical protein
MLMPIFVAHYTVDTPYEELVCRLKHSLKKFNLPYYIEPIKSLGSWRLNSNYSAWLVQKCLKMFPNRPILKTDADAVVQNYPYIFEDKDFNPDVAACIWYRFRKRGELLGGTLYFANNEKSNKIVDDWVDLCTKYPNNRNPVLLEQALWGNNNLSENKWPEQSEKITVKNKTVFQKLPLEYCKIFDLMRASVETPVIEHFQASRKCKKLIGK